jgi:ubiquinone/menaquinone biosynthesis C-methylase UbiE
MNQNDQFKSIYFDILLADFKGKVLARAHGNYTKSYESFKRINNTEICFRESIRDKQQQQKVLDIGCGDGYHLFLFNTVESIAGNIRFYGVDTSKLRIEFASRVCNELAITNVNFLVGSADDLPFPDDHFDIILCSDVVEHLSYPERCLAEIYRVTKQGGTAIVTTPNKTNRLQQLARFFQDRLREERQEDDHISVKGINEWMKLARAAGFGILKAKRGALLFGGDRYNQYPVLFAIVVMIDRLFDFIPFFKNWSEAFTLKLIKLRNV